MHYFNKLPKLKLISASQNTLKGNSKINRVRSITYKNLLAFQNPQYTYYQNEEKFKSAEVKLKRVH